MSDRRTFLLSSARKHDIYSMLRKYLGKSSDNCHVDFVEWGNGDIAWCVQFSEVFSYDVYQLKDIFRHVLVVGELSIVIGVKRGR